MDTWHTYMVETKDNRRGTARKKKKKIKSYKHCTHSRATFLWLFLTRERHLTVWPPASLQYNTMQTIQTNYAYSTPCVRTVTIAHRAKVILLEIIALWTSCIVLDVLCGFCTLHLLAHFQGQLMQSSVDYHNNFLIAI